MGGGIEYGKCEICGNEGPLERTYFYYPIHCDCCGSKDENGQKRHFVIARHCERCAPAIPYNIKVTMTDHNGNGYTARVRMEPCEIEGKFTDGTIIVEERRNGLQD